VFTALLMAISRVQETMMRTIASVLLVVVVAFFCGRAASAQSPADVVLLNGKIVTVDD
jgi:hypothetical protein